MTLSSKWIGILVVFASVTPLAYCDAPQVSAKSSVVKDDKGKELLQISLTNHAKDLEVSAAHLPWSHWHSLTIVAVKADTSVGIPIPIDPPFDDPALGQWVIKSKQTV